MTAGAQALAVAALLAAGLLFAQTGPGGSALGQLGLASEPERFTELAFADAGALPQGVARAGNRLKFSFTVTNSEGRPRDYRWSASERGVNASQPVVGTLSLAAGASEEVAVKLPAVCPGERSRIEVRLDALPEPIGFWVTCPAGQEDA